MPFYYSIRWMEPEMRARTLAGLTRLRAQLDAELPRKTHSHTLVLGTWNIRNFDDNRFVNGTRTEEDLYYIAEIISRFDVIAVQEVCDDLRPLDKVMRLLGNAYEYILTDVTEGRAGNDERLGFIYDRNKVRFQGVAGEIVLPDRLQIIADGTKRQFSRTPFMCSFQSGWFKFKFSTVHIYFGETSGAKYRRRVEEIRKVAEFLAKRAELDEASHILVGDFNIVRAGSDGDNALREAGFTAVQNRLGSNRDQTKFYDQISFIQRENRVRLTRRLPSHGVFQFFDSIYREEDFDAYKPLLRAAIDEKIAGMEAEIEELEGKISRARSDAKKDEYREDIVKERASIADWQAIAADDARLATNYADDWRTFHGSDQLPLWVELEIDFSAEYLASLAEA